MNNFLVNSMHGGQIVDHDAHRPREEQSHVHLLLPPPSSNCKMFCVHFCAKPSVPAASAIARNTPPPAEGTWNTLSSTANTSLSSHNTSPSKEKPGAPSSWWTRFSSRKGPGVSSEVMKVEEERSLSAYVDPCVSKRL